MVTWSQVDLWEHSGSFHLIKQIINAGQWVLVLDGDFTKGTIIYAQPHASILLFDKQNWRFPWRRTRSDVPIVNEYPNVFPEELPGMPPDRDIEFVIDLVPRTAPISKRPYRMPADELVEMKKQLKE